MALAPVQTIGLVALAAAGALGSSLGLNANSAAQRFIPSEHPAAVLAWAQTRCGQGITLQASTPRAHADDVMTVAAAYESELRYRPLDAVCADALRVARPVLAVDANGGVAKIAPHVIAAR